jgi:hypothetical protein
LDLSASYSHRTRKYRQYSAVADLHTLQFIVTHALGFSVFTCRILATDLSQCHCHFKSHMKSSFHSLIPFFLLFCNCQLNSIPLLPSSYPGRLTSQNSIRLFSNELIFIKHFARTTHKTRPLLFGGRVYSSVAKQRKLLDFCSRIRCRRNVFTESLPSNEQSIGAC